MVRYSSLFLDASVPGILRLTLTPSRNITGSGNIARAAGDRSAAEYPEGETLLRVNLNRSAKWPHALNRYRCLGINLMHAHYVYTYTRIRMHVRTLKVTVPNHVRAHLINRTFTNSAKFKAAIHLVAILIRARTLHGVRYSSRVIITSAGNAERGEVARRNAIRRINLHGTLKPASTPRGIYYHRVEND